MFRAAFPCVPMRGCANAFTSNHMFGLASSNFPLPKRYAYCGTNEPVLWTLAAVTLKGGPESNETIPWALQPPTRNPGTPPALPKNFLPGPKGKLRLLYEAAPLAMVVEQAGGAASTGTERILDVQPTSLHQKVPLIIGSRDDVAEYNQFYVDATASAAD